MDTQELIEKMNAGNLSPEEQEQALTQINTELVALKEHDPEKYLELLEKLNEVLEELNNDLKDI